MVTAQVVTGLQVTAAQVVTGLQVVTAQVVTGLHVTATQVVTGLQVTATAVVTGLQVTTAQVVTGRQVRKMPASAVLSIRPTRPKATHATTIKRFIGNLLSLRPHTSNQPHNPEPWGKHFRG